MRALLTVLVSMGFYQLCAQAPETNGQETVYAVVCGKPLTGEHVRSVVLLKAKILELRKKQIPEDRFAAWANRLAAKSIPELISQRYFLQALDLRKIKATPAATAEILQRYNRLLRTKAKTPKELALKFGDQASAFSGQFEFESRVEALYRQFPKYEISALAVTNEMRRIERLRVKSVAVNEEAVKKGNAAYARLKAGEDWLKVAEEVAEDDLIDAENGEHFCREWGTFNIKDFSDELAAAVAALKPGEFTKPIETDEGLLIVKLVKKDGDGYECVRIGFRMAIVPITPSASDLCKKLKKEAAVAIQREMIGPIRKANPVAYPLGRKVKIELWDVKRKGQRKSE